MLRVVDEVVLGDSNTEAAVEEFICRTSELKGFPDTIPITIYGDASDNRRTTKAARTDYQIVR